ncbi:1-aminocyclopropane-1-carboxylate deaminase/D-cysteine desulfhydrase [Spirosoma oryzicola]|uniref:1-aminocyclopropane-1-carboxylate deaminase/D-cysteine desulfhydrase n=1 Tax=Spirosoma oryzicola TaxID=2898794 RepID=UPI001E5BE11B|nr:pyridoxal-phosphate dependent enzyme [Spirosoma oryzicola]UHG89479.1 pyridoxal-phosphate dependent enzyme [Spirosoma oryzicola]
MDELARQLSQLAGNSPVQLLSDPFPEPVGIRLLLKRDDLLHPLVSGNKWRKLKYNLLEARKQGFDTLLTFGGAYSNHLYATAAAGNVFGFKTIGVVRGEELANVPRNPTLLFCESCGMDVQFVSRAEYRRKEEPDYLLSLTDRFGPCYVLPEGGTNELAMRGASEIMPELIAQLGNGPDYVCCSVGTGGTVGGLVQSAPSETTVVGFLALNASDFRLPFERETHLNFRLDNQYAFGGYARTTPDLLYFIRQFERKTGVLLEQVYTGKMLYGIYDLARQGFFPEGAAVVAIHTGGLQGRSLELDRSEK